MISDELVEVWDLDEHPCEDEKVDRMLWFVVIDKEFKHEELAVGIRGEERLGLKMS